MSCYRWVAAVALVLMPSCDGAARHTEAARLLEAGDARAALVTTSLLLAERRAERGEATDDVSFARANWRLLSDHGVAALAAGDFGAAEEAARLLALVDTRECEASSNALSGGARHERARLAAVQALGPEAEPFALSGALVLANSAREAWVRALLGRGAWPEVARNIERVDELVRELEQRRAEAEAARPQTESDGTPNIQVVPEASASEDSTGDGREDTAAALAPLSAEELLALVEALASKETQKLDARRARRARVSSDVERDW